MLKAFEPMKGLLKVKHFTTSDFFFAINTKFTPFLLLFFAILLTVMDLLRTSIDCYTDNNDGRKAIMDNYCWSIGTYICKDRPDDVFKCNMPSEDKKIYQRYYQWLSLVFVIQALIAYTPAHFWKVAEGGLMHKICDKLDKLDNEFDEKKWTDKKNRIMDYFNSQYARVIHMKYVRHFIAFKMLSCAFIIVNIILLHMIIPGYWGQYSQAITALFTGDANNWKLHSESLFPKITKCTYQSFGPSGSLQDFDARCLLPLNVLNQKIFVIIWIWFIVQLVVSALNLLYWIVISYSENVRIYILCQKCITAVPRKSIMHASRKGHLGHFFVLNQISKNTSAYTFVEFMSDLALSTTNPDQNANKSMS